MKTVHKLWTMRDPAPPPEQIDAWARELGVSRDIANLIWLRGATTLDEMGLYLAPGLRHLAPPKSWPGVEEAAKIIAKGLLSGKKMAVWGDYDVDGVTSTALVKSVLAAHGFDIAHYLPHRTQDGYGLNPQGIKILAEEGINLLLTVDCGINDHEAIEVATSLGITVVVSDHHLPSETLPPAAAICNPLLPGSPFNYLAGVGIAFFLMAELNSILCKHFGKNYDIREVLDLVALGTLADMVPLQGQNRILAKNGMLLLNEGARPGVMALKSIAGFTPKSSMGATPITFSLAPRINAAGRLGHAEDALYLLLSTSAYEAEGLAEKLDNMNKDRRQQENGIFKEAFEQAKKFKDDPAIVLYEPAWHSGIIGIVASRIVEACYKPTLVLCDDNGFLKGSGRSIRGLNLHEALGSCAHLLERFGGHSQAAGLTLLPEKLAEFRKMFCEAVTAQTKNIELAPTLLYDAEASFALTCNGDYLKELELMQPFGVENPEPVFISPPLKIKSIVPFGYDHATLELVDESCDITMRIKAWRRADHFPSSGVGHYLKIAYSPRLTEYNGVASAELSLLDWRWLS